MEDIIANVDDIKFDIEIALEQQLGLQPLPFPGMDKSAAAICDFYITNRCKRGPLCPLRHISGNQMVVCKHWLRGLCKKGDDCEFLHKYDMDKMPECYFFIKYGQCSNKECPFLHLNPADKIKDCPWYDRGFCKHANYSMKVWKNWPLHPKDMNEKTVDWIFVIDSLNFSFWLPTEKQFEVEFEGVIYRDYEALCACVNRAIKEGIEITSPKVYKDISQETVNQAFRSSNGTTLPLLEERKRILNENGKILHEKYGSTFVNFLNSCENDAEKAIQLLLEHFPTFCDFGEYKETEVSFCKRAQILLADIWACFEGESFGDFKNIDILTMFPDYRVPQTLLALKVIRYSEKLKQIITDGRELLYGSDSEMEIRGCSIHSVELLRQELQKIISEKKETTLVNSIIIDFYLWDYATGFSEISREFPEHRTRSIYY